MKVSDVRPLIERFEQQIPVGRMIGWTRVARSSYYYRSRGGRRGRRPSSETPMADGTLVANPSVVIAVKFLLGVEFVNYGYHKMTVALQQDGFMINHKKVHRLMKEGELLHNGRIRTQAGQRPFVRYFKQSASAPMEQLSMDIKYVHIHGNGRNALLLTVLDVFSRRVIGQLLWWRMRQGQVRWLLSAILERYPVQGITLRNDNGSQFLAGLVRQYLKDQGVNQEFTHVATPQENAFIEAYHSVLDAEVMQRYEFESIYEAGLVLDRWKRHYNEVRPHGKLKKRTPQRLWDDHYPGIDPLKAPTAIAPKEKSRPAAGARPGAAAAAASYSLDFFGGAATFAKSGEKSTKMYLTNQAILSSL